MISHYSSFFEIVLWSFLTVFCYILAKKINHHFLKWWSAPVILTPLFLAVILLLSKTAYHTYFLATSYLSLMAGPATVAFAVPIYEKREIIFRYYKILFLAVLFGSIISMILVFLLCDILALDKVLGNSHLVPSGRASKRGLPNCHWTPAVSDITLSAI